MDWGFDNTYARELGWLGMATAPVPVERPELLYLGADLAVELGLDPQWLAGPDGVRALAGSEVPEGAEPLAQAYAGHQFGFFSPRLGDGRAHLLGEVIDRTGRRRDIALKGSGRTVFSRGGDGRAAIRPVLREVVISEAMAALGVPTTRALAATATGEQVWRDGGPEPGAVLTRVADSHLRVGTLELVRTQGSLEQLRALVDYVRARHYPHLEPGDVWGLWDEIAGRQAELVAHWMSLGFIHGVMNTDNVAISGETIDYGPCAFLDRYDPDTVYSSIDTAGRYRYSAQPAVAAWNLARLAETLLPLAGDDADAAVETATERVAGFAQRYALAFRSRMAGKLGLEHVDDADEVDRLVGSLLETMRRGSLDFTGTFRALGRSLREGGAPDGLEDWVDAWRPVLTRPEETAAEMDAVNPAYIPRNHLVEEALDAARDGDLGPFEELVDVLRRPFEERADRQRYAEPAPERFAATYVTFCGT